MKKSIFLAILFLMLTAVSTAYACGEMDSSEEEGIDQSVVTEGALL